MNTALHGPRDRCDGVLCFYVDMGRPASAAHLIFRQGLADEPLHETGWLHLLEHLALLDRETLSRPINGQVSMLLTRFAAFGATDELVDHLGALCRWMAEPDLRCWPASAACCRPGPISATTPDAVPDVAVRRHRAGRRELRRGRLAAGDAGAPRGARAGGCSTPPTRSWSWTVPRRPTSRFRCRAGEYLPPSPVEPISATPARGLPRRGRADAERRRVADPRGDLPSRLLERAVHDGLRQSTGGVYAPWSSTTEIDDEHLVIGGGSDVVPEILGTVAGAGLDVVRRLAGEGVPRAWVEEAVQQRLARLESPNAIADVALESAYAALSSRVPLSHEELVDQLRDTDPQLVDSAARELDATLLVGLPEDAKLPRGLKPVSFPTSEPAAEGKRHTHVNWPADLSTFTADTTLAESVSGTTAHAMRIDDVVGLFTWRDGTRQLVGRDGSVLEMEARQWFSGDALADTLDQAVSEDLHIPMPDREVTFKRMGLAERSAIGFARAANTKPGLIVLISLMLLLTLWSVIGGHRFLAFVLLVLGATLGAQLWRVEGGQLGGPPPPSPGPA